MTNRKKLIEGIMASFYAMKNKMHAKIVDPEHKDGITNSQLFVLAIIEEHEHIGIKELSRMLNISSSASTQLVDGLVENNYVVRKADLKDRRALRLELSAKGHKQITAMKKRQMETVEKLFGALNDRELESYLGLHKKIMSNVLSKK